MYATCVASVEFINMMAAADRLADAARILCHLEAGGLLTGSVWETQVAAARNKIGELPYPPAGMDDRQALDYMRRTLRELARNL